MNSNSNNNMNKDNLTPIFRSMSLGGAPAPLFLQQTNNDNAMAAAVAAAPITKQKSLPCDYSHTILMPSASSTWAPVESLRKLSYYHPLDPSHLTLDKQNLPEMLQVLKKMFQTLSCQVTYETQRITANARTMEDVEFQVAFWASRDDAQTVLCEVQRMAGDSYTYHTKYAQPIMQAMRQQQQQQQITPVATTTTPRQCGMTLDQIIMEEDDEQLRCTEQDIQQALELAESMILSDRYDAKELGMQSLAGLVDPTVTGLHTATIVARDLQTCARWKTITKFLWNQLFHPTSEWNLGALKIWVQIWQLQGTTATANAGLDTESIVSLLMQYVENASHSPHHATLALQGLTALCRNQPRAQAHISWAPVQYANALGHAQHAALAYASQQLLAVHC